MGRFSTYSVANDSPRRGVGGPLAKLSFGGEGLLTLCESVTTTAKRPKSGACGRQALESSGLYE